MNKYYIKFSGSAFGIEADTKDEAWKKIQHILDCYCSKIVLEIGKNVDELGYDIKPITNPRQA